MKRIDMTHRICGTLEVLCYAGNDRRGNAMWQVLCFACGSLSVVRGYDLRNGKAAGDNCTTTMGTFHLRALTGDETVRRPREKHGHWRRDEDGKLHPSPTLSSYTAMRKRTRNRNSPSAKWYSAKGVKCCPRWDLFSNFLADMGIRPEGTTLDRIDPFGDYTPENTRWSSPKVQANNQRRHHKAKVSTLAPKAA